MSSFEIKYQDWKNQPRHNTEQVSPSNLSEQFGSVSKGFSYYKYESDSQHLSSVKPGGHS